MGVFPSVLVLRLKRSLRASELHTLCNFCYDGPFCNWFECFNEKKLKSLSLLFVVLFSFRSGFPFPLRVCAFHLMMCFVLYAFLFHATFLFCAFLLYATLGRITRPFCLGRVDAFVSCDARFRLLRADALCFMRLSISFSPRWCILFHAAVGWESRRLMVCMHFVSCCVAFFCFGLNWLPEGTCPTKA